MTTSMVNLSGNSNSNFVNSLRKTPDFGMSTEHPFFLYFFYPICFVCTANYWIRLQNTQILSYVFSPSILC